MPHKKALWMSEEQSKNFIDSWLTRDHKECETALFWVSLLQDVLEIDRPADYLQFAKPLPLLPKCYIDVYLPKAEVLVAMQNAGCDLDKEQARADGFVTTPYGRALRYAAALPPEEKPRYIITCNFKEFRIYNQEDPPKPPVVIKLANLTKEAYKLNFITDAHKAALRHEFALSIKAGEIVGALYKGFLEEYRQPEAEKTLKSLNILCVRLVFCLFAEKAGIFGKKGLFLNYLQSFAASGMQRALLALFKTLATKEPDRAPDIDKKLAAFPHIKGGLFTEEKIEIPIFSEKLKSLLLNKAAADFDWSGISPTIFGAIFESTLNRKTRQNNGMHYTAPENIHKVIGPLFLNDLKAELAEIRLIKQADTRRKRLKNFRTKLANLTFLDPACGAGNFLTAAYLSLRELENETLLLMPIKQIKSADKAIIQVKTTQFYGIEINSFAVSVARTALLIAENQMLNKTRAIVHNHLDFLTLSSLSNIIHGNALRMNWNNVVPKDKINYIIGNPPFIGKSYQTNEQKKDLQIVFKGINGFGNLDYVTCWYKKAADFMEKSNIRAALVSTNSICQGIAVYPLWNYLQAKGIIINFAYKSFRWNSEASAVARVHCVIIGFSYKKYQYAELVDSQGEKKRVQNINAYLLALPNIIVKQREQPFYNDLPPMTVGSCPTDGGGFIFTAGEYQDFIKKEPQAKKFFHQYIGSQEFLHGKSRYCLWLKDIKPSEIQNLPLIKERISIVQNSRLKSNKKATRDKASSPTLFAEDRYIPARSLFIPMRSSELRAYIPMGFIDAKVIASNLGSVIPHADLYHFGILTSHIHMVWVAYVGCRLETRLSYGPKVIYNTFPWPQIAEKAKEIIRESAKKILAVRSKYSQNTYHTLYTNKFMPPDLRAAHQENDRAVSLAYGLAEKATDEEIFAALLLKYQELEDKEAAIEAEKKKPFTI